MITIFDILQFSVALGAAMTGYRLGHAGAGRAGAFAGAVVGAAAGWIVGRVPAILASRWVHRAMRRANSADLRSRLERDYFLSHIILAELASRGEPLESLRPFVVAQLNSESADVQRFGRANAKMWFPDLLERT